MVYWRKIRNPFTAVHLMDKMVDAKNSIGRQLTREEFAKIRPNDKARALYFVFTHKSPLYMDSDIGNALIKKFPSIYIVTAKQVPLSADDDLEAKRGSDKNKYVANEFRRILKHLNLKCAENKLKIAAQVNTRADLITAIRIQLKALVDAGVKYGLPEAKIDAGITEKDGPPTWVDFLPEADKPLSEMTESEYRAFATESIKDQLKKNESVTDVNKMTEQILVAAMKMYKVGTDVPEGENADEDEQAHSTNKTEYLAGMTYFGTVKSSGTEVLILHADPVNKIFYTNFGLPPAKYAFDEVEEVIARAIVLENELVFLEEHFPEIKDTHPDSQASHPSQKGNKGKVE